MAYQLDLELKDPNDRTPLRLAIVLGHLESVEVLLEFGANSAAQDAEGAL